MHGLGNDYVYLNFMHPNLKNKDNQLIPENLLSKLAIQISDRHYGVGSDGLVLIEPGETQFVKMRMFNSDGSEAEMCGNAIRCIAQYVFDSEIVHKKDFAIQTMNRDYPIQILTEGQVRVDMGKPNQGNLSDLMKPNNDISETLSIHFPKSEAVNYRFSRINMGNPHAVVFLNDEENRNLGKLSSNEINLTEIGPQFENHPVFPNKTNVEFVTHINDSEIAIRVWERGSGETLACGTGACAAAVASIITGRTNRKITVHLTGGDLEIDWNESTNHVYMTGPTQYVFSGNFIFHLEDLDRLEEGET